MQKRLITMLMALMLFGVSAHAVYVKAPANIIVLGEQKDIPIAITNDTKEEQDYNIYFSSPIEYTISPIAGKLGAGKTTITTLSIKPNESLSGTTYEGTLEVKMGEEKTSKGISILFKEKETGEEQAEENGNSTGFFALGGISSFILSFFTIENAVNIFLVALAAILLIAFIARFVKRLEASK